MSNYPKKFKVASVSVNTNSFGLYSIILVARDGECWQGCRSNLVNPLKKGDVVELMFDSHSMGYNWAAYGFEIPEAMVDMPAMLVSELWTDQPEARAPLNDVEKALKYARQIKSAVSRSQAKRLACVAEDLLSDAVIYLYEENQKLKELAKAK